MQPLVAPLTKAALVALFIHYVIRRAGRKGRGPRGRLTSTARNAHRGRGPEGAAPRGRDGQAPPPAMQPLVAPLTKAALVALFILAILLILYVILWYICRDVDAGHGL